MADHRHQTEQQPLDRFRCSEINRSFQHARAGLTCAFFVAPTAVRDATGANSAVASAPRRAAR
jgi:hypothetical protein